MRNRMLRTLLAASGAVALSACMVGPNYHNPGLGQPTPPAFKEQG